MIKTRIFGNTGTGVAIDGSFLAADYGQKEDQDPSACSAEVGLCHSRQVGVTDVSSSSLYSNSL